MFDFLFSDPGFGATIVEVEPTSEAGEAYFAKHFGVGAASASLKKSGAYEMMAAVAKDNLTYRVR